LVLIGWMLARGCGLLLRLAGERNFGLRKWPEGPKPSRWDAI